MKLHAEIMNIQAKPYDGTDAYTHYCKGHRDARHAAAEMAIKADQLAEAVKAVMEWRVDTPTRGELRDCDKSREALRHLAWAIKQYEA
jgi:hypothetical protein